MPDHDALYQAILDNPDDDTLRLVYADWLEENADAARAEFIRIQIEQFHLPENSSRWLALLGREFELLNEHKTEWIGYESEQWNVTFEWGLPAMLNRKASVPKQRTIAFDRGLPAIFEIDNCKFNEQDAELIGQAPIRHIRLADLAGRKMPNVLPVLQEIVNQPTFSRVRYLELDHCTNKHRPNGPPGEELGRVIAASPNANGLRAIRFFGEKIGTRGVEHLTKSPYLTNLRWLDLAMDELEDGGVDVLAAWPGLKNLTGLGLGGNGLTEEHLSPLFASPYLGGLRRLSLGRENNFPSVGVNNLSAEGIATLGNCPELASLEELDLGWHFDTFDDEIGEALGRSKCLTSLRRLKLSLHDCTPAFFQALAKFNPFPALEHLELSYQLTEEHMTHLASWPGLNNLRFLTFGANQYDDPVAFLRPLVESDEIRSLETFVLAYLSCPWKEVLTMLARASWLRSVKALFLEVNNLASEDFYQFFASPHWNSLEQLELLSRSNNCSGAIDGLRASPIFSNLRYLNIPVREDTEKSLEKLLTAPNRNPNLKLRVDPKEISPEFAKRYSESLTSYRIRPPFMGKDPWPEIYR